MTIENIHKILDEILGPRLMDTGDDHEPRIDRDYVVDILMDYMYNNRDRHYVVETLQTIIGTKMSFLELCALIEEVDCLKEGKRE